MPYTTASNLKDLRLCRDVDLHWPLSILYRFAQYVIAIQALRWLLLSVHHEHETYGLPLLGLIILIRIVSDGDAVDSMSLRARRESDGESPLTARP